ncbi:mitochondrial peptide methionine sulfoxide reductase isoform X1 [Meleagris gallopavo]|uniref:peptide-methionine (S)-S-oxide reductase n=1 Tax=Meleagris gallopavo TaxID=9103 RepID=A0A803Y1J7_MELGA|nr:mitochondrial peptide methionine sulfoxide reductase isoform X1 [Meleagris gallopavo]
MQEVILQILPTKKSVQDTEIHSVDSSFKNKRKDKYFYPPLSEKQEAACPQGMLAAVLRDFCSIFNQGRTGHTEAVRVVYQPENISFEKLLKVFWENHDPTQGMRQGNDFGTQYRSAIYTFSQEQMEAALKSKEEYQKVLTESGFGAITTEIREAPEFYYAEDYHQQYLSKNPNGYCGLGGTGISCPIGIRK